MEELVALLKAKQLTISSCESFTGGLFCAKMAEIPGVSSVLMGGLVTYQNNIKEGVAHVCTNTIHSYGVVSRECVVEMAENTNTIMHSDICVSFSGNAGPSSMEGKPAGLVYCAIACPKATYTYEFFIKKTRNEVREEVVNNMCEEVIRIAQTL